MRFPSPDSFPFPTKRASRALSLLLPLLLSRFSVQRSSRPCSASAHYNSNSVKHWKWSWKCVCVFYVKAEGGGSLCPGIPDMYLPIRTSKGHQRDINGTSTGHQRDIKVNRTDIKGTSKGHQRDIVPDMYGHVRTCSGHVADMYRHNETIKSDGTAATSHANASAHPIGWMTQGWMSIVRVLLDVLVTA